MDDTDQLWCEVNMDSGNDLVPSDNRPSLDPTQFIAAIWPPYRQNVSLGNNVLMREVFW